MTPDFFLHQLLIEGILFLPGFIQYQSLPYCLLFFYVSVEGQAKPINDIVKSLMNILCIGHVYFSTAICANSVICM